MNKIKFTYILGGNLELYVTAAYLPEEAFWGDEVHITDVSIFTHIDCESATLDFETDDIYIKNNQGKFESLDSLLEEAAREELSKPSKEEG